MANINLLPWREERRQEMQKAFITVLVAIAMFAGFLVWLADMQVNNQIENQTARNNYLQKNIDELNRQVKEIQELEKKKKELLAKRKVIQELQGNRPIIVRIFDEMVRTLPDGVFYKSLNRKEKAISLKGNAESNNRISSLMRKLEESDWFAGPNLTAVTASPEFGEQASSFTLSFNITTPSSKDKEKIK